MKFRIAAIVLAAGESKRFGFPKQLIVRDGEPLVRRIARAAAHAGADPVVVVLGANADIITPELADLTSVTTVVNGDWSRGLSSSLVTGLAAVFPVSSCDAVLVMLADQPLIDTGALKRLMETFDEKRRIIASAYDGTIGVPAVFAREFAGDLMQLTGDAGAGAWLRGRRDVTTVPLAAGAVDIDTELDLARLR